MKASLNSLHLQGEDWLRELSFYKDELNILKKRLEEVASKNTKTDVTSMVEHFQNKFIVLLEDIDTLHHDIEARENKLEDLAKQKPEHIAEHFSVVKDPVLPRVKDLNHSIADTRFEFNQFLAKVM